jgi:hypothetical protein
MYILLINHNFNDRYKVKLGSAESIRGCYDYLRDKPKWTSFAMAQEEAELKKHCRPVGKKKEKKVSADKAIVVSALKEFRDSDKKQQPTEVETKGNNYEAELLSSISTSLKAVAASHKEEYDMALIALMDSPDRKELLAIKKQVLVARYKQQLKDINDNNHNNKTDKPTDSDEEDNDLYDITKKIF